MATVLTINSLGQSLDLHYLDAHSGESFGFYYNRKINERNNVSAGLKLHFSRSYDRDNLANAFKNRLSPNGFAEHFGLGLKHTFLLLDLTNGHSIGLNSGIHLAYASIASDSYILSLDVSTNENIYYTFSRINDGPILWLEPEIGLILNLKLYEKLYLTSTLGFSLSLIKGEFSSYAGDTFYEFGMPFSTGVSYRLK